MDKVAFTVFTPTFNRAHTLHRVHGSLGRQTYRDFEWLVVDDGSADGTGELIAKWSASSPFPIRYLYQRNRGKHVAFNTGVCEARGRFFLALDSDDACAPQALERFKWHWDDIPETSQDRFTGVTALCEDQHGRLVGSRFPRDVMDSDSNEIRYRFRVAGEKWGFHRTEVLRQYPFPTPAGARFLPEGLVWSAIARSYRTRFVNEILRVYWREPTDASRISSGRLSRATASALALLQRSVLNDDLRWLRFAPAQFLRTALNYSRFSFDSGTGLVEQCRQLDAAPRLLWLASLPLGYAASIRDRARNPLRLGRPRAPGAAPEDEDEKRPDA